MKADSNFKVQLPAVPARSVPTAGDAYEGAPTQMRQAPVRSSATQFELPARPADEIAELPQLAERAKQRLAESGSELTIEFNDDLDRMIFKIIDKRTKEVLRQVPTEEALAVARALAEGGSVGALMRSSA